MCVPPFSGEATKNLPPEARQRVEGVTQGVTGVGADALQTVGGGVKGLVDTAGNTVRLLLLRLLLLSPPPLLPLIPCMPSTFPPLPQTHHSIYPCTHSSLTERYHIQVGTLGGGLSDTVTGVAGGLGKVASGAGQTASAPFTSAETKEGEGEGAGGSAKGAADSAIEGAGEAGGKAGEAVGGAKDKVGGAAGEGQKKLGLSE